MCLINRNQYIASSLTSGKAPKCSNTNKPVSEVEVIVNPTEAEESNTSLGSLAEMQLSPESRIIHCF